MQLKANVFDVWTYRDSGAKTEYLLLHTSQMKADRFFNGGRFWQIPSNFMADGETVTGAVDRLLSGFGLTPTEVWAAEHVYTIYAAAGAQAQIARRPAQPGQPTCPTAAASRRG